MRAEPSKLAQLVIAYYEKFGRHVPESALRLLDAAVLATHLQNSLANNLPLPATGWVRDSPDVVFWCALPDWGRTRGTPRKKPNGEWLQ